MCTKLSVGACVLAAIAGQALAQPVVNGRLDGNDASFYGPPLAVQQNTTGFGDASASSPCDPSGLGGDPAAVTTGIEFAISLADIGATVGQPIGMCVFYNGGNHNFVSSQFLPGVPNGTANFGSPASAVNLNNVPGTQHVFFTPTVLTGPDAIVINGQKDGAYGTAHALQTNRTGFDNATTGTAGGSCNGSELNGMYAVVWDDPNDSPDAGPRLYVMLTGNQKTDFTKIEIFFDTIANQGQNVLRGDNASVDFNDPNVFLAGFTFDTGFAPDYYLTWGTGDNTFFPNYVRLRVDENDGGFGAFIGCFDRFDANLGSGCGNDDVIKLQAEIDNSNTAGVIALCPDPTGTEGIANGSELNALYAYADQERLYVLLTGNIENASGSPCTEGGNKLMVFIDADGSAGGQNRLLNNNIGVGFGALRNLGGVASGSDGFTFDDGFSPDYWIGAKAYRNFGSPNAGAGFLGVDAATIRSDGRAVISGFDLDYGAFDGADLSVWPAVTFKNENYLCDPTLPTFDANNNLISGGDPDLWNPPTSGSVYYTNFAPRLVSDQVIANDPNNGGQGLIPFQPVGTPGLLVLDLDNSNVGGVQGSGGSVDGAASATTGLEFSIDLAELATPAAPSSASASWR